MRRYEGIVFDSSRWGGFELRPGDIIISTPPKCGTTWTQMICALLILQEPELPLPLDTLSPWIDMMTRSRDDEIIVFEQEFALAQSQGNMPGGNQSGIDDLVAAQKEIVVSTWKLDRRARAAKGAKSESDIKAVARAEAELKTRCVAGLIAEIGRAGTGAAAG